MPGFDLDEIMTRISRFTILFIATLLPALSAGAPVSSADQGQSGSPSEYEVKAAFLLNFVRFTVWPDDALPDSGAPIVIGIVGNDPFNGSLDRTISGKTAGGRPLLIKRFGAGDNLRECQVVFISSSEKKRLPQILGAINGSSILTVGDVKEFVESGGIISFVVESNKIRFEVNAGAASRARLKISSKLLSLARAVTN
jgi:uncharacterized protein DUF4154